MPARTLTVWLARRVLLGSLVGVICGAASAGFLWLLDAATQLRGEYQTLVFGLPLAGLALGWFYERFGESVKAGNSLVIARLTNDGPAIPLRMASMVLLGTVVTHLLGGSAGREGTAVQMGASLTDWLSHRLGLDRELRSDLLTAGVAAGFGSVFGTPIAGAIFALEFVGAGRVRYSAIVPALIASLVGDLTTRALGIKHTLYPAIASFGLTPLLLLKWLVFAVSVALTAVTFIELTRFIKKQGEAHIARLPYRMFVGGLVVVGLWQLVGSNDYLGLGVPMIVRAFEDPTLPAYAFALKLLFTSVTIGAGFIGGEVTPLFFIGATLGSVLGRLLNLPIELGAGVGLAAVFAACANTPLALSVMTVELLGVGAFPHVFMVCILAHLLVGKRSIYHRPTSRGPGGVKP